MDWRPGKTYNVESSTFDGSLALRYYGDLFLPWLGATVHLFYSDEKSQLTENVNYTEGDLIALRDEDIVSATEGRGRSGGFPYN
jgi:hypothetical protein